MLTPFQEKEQTILDAPLFLFDCTLAGVTYNWSSHHVTVQGTEYRARVMRTNVFEMQVSSEGGVDTIPKISFELANADGLMSELQRSNGFKGATVTVRFVFYNLLEDVATTDPLPVFQGVLDSPEIITESTLRVSAINRLSLQRIALPPLRVQKRCLWQFPATAAQRLEAVDGGSAGRFSRFYNCGYSPDIQGGCGNLNQGAPFTSCDYSRTQCEQRGMFSVDSSGRTTARFSGIEYVPPVITVRAAGEKGSQLSVIQDNEARYNDFVPLVYGTGWYRPSIVFARNDGNLTHFEVLLGTGQMTRVITVLVNDIEIPVGRAGTNMTGTGWYNVVSYGTRSGVFNRDFSDKSGNPLGDPYGSMAYMQLVVPNSINDGRSVPDIQVLADGLQIETFAADGTSAGFMFTNNPVWIVVDVLRRSGWSLGEIDLSSFRTAADYCDESIETTDLNGKAITTRRFQCNLVLQSRRSAGDVIRGIRNASRLYLVFSTSGLLQMRIENTLALQQPDNIEGSNATAALNGGWPVYEFGDGTNGTTGIARAADQSSTFRITSRGSADTPNRFSVEFQDAFNSYQQDSVTLVDPDDVQDCGFEVSATPNVLGVPNYNQAARIVALCLNKSVAGNTYIQFETSVRALGIQPGDIIAVTHSREGFDRTPFRVVKIAPGHNFQRALVRAQLHDDAWYTDQAGGSFSSSGPQASYRVGIPRCIAGVTDDGQFAVTETAGQADDGTATLLASVQYVVPPAVALNAPNPPLVSLAPIITTNYGTQQPNTAYYYALTAVDEAGNESRPSFAVHVLTGDGSPTYSVTLQDISLPATATRFHVYRGPNPAELLRISSNNNPADTFTDTGFSSLQILPPDASYDHANLYWRAEAQAPAVVTSHSSNSIGSNALNMQANQFAGMTVRIVSGAGARQERVIVSNTESTISIAPPWTIEPDTSSAFVVSQTAYQFAASSATDRAQFAIPNLTGAIIQICGRSANVYDIESPYELSAITRWQIGGAGINMMDSDVPPAPVFGLTVLPEGGGLELGNIGFHTLNNTRTISLGTLTLYYSDEGSIEPPPALANDISATDSIITLTLVPAFTFPQFLAIGREIVRLTGPTADGLGFVADRGIHSTAAAAHSASDTAFPLMQLTVTFPFLEDFFGTPASGNWTQSIVLANARICSAELFVTNSRGNGPVSSSAFTSLVGGGLRTLTGGQVTLQVAGNLAIQNAAVPPLDPGATYAVKDVYAYVGSAPADTSGISLRITLDGQTYCTLDIAAGQSQSLPQDGASLPVLRAAKLIGLDIIRVGNLAPGSDLTVVIRV